MVTKSNYKTSTTSVVGKKVELQSWGVRISAELIDELEAGYNMPAARTGRMVLCLESPAGNGKSIPAFIVNGKRGEVSPYYLAGNSSGGFEVHIGGNKYVDITLLPRPRFYDSRTPGGIPRHKLAVIVGPGHLRSVVNQRCYYQSIGRPCKFCAVQRWWDADTEKSVEDIADTVVMAVEEGVVDHVSLTTGTLNTPGKGLEHLVEVAGLTQARVSVPIMLEFEPLDDFTLLGSLLKRAVQAGVTTVSCNIECFDERLRPQVMPEKGRIPVATYLRTWEHCLKIFGKNDVFTVAVAGIGEDDKSLLNGIEMAASHDVMTFLVPHSPAAGAVYEDMQAPDPDRMLSLYSRAVAIYRERGLDIRASKAGCVRGGGFSAIKDVAEYEI